MQTRAIQDGKSKGAPRTRRGRIAVVAILAFVIVRLWPLVPITTGWNLRGAIVHQPPGPEFLPPPVAPVEVRSGRAHPGFDLPQLFAELLFLPTAIRRGHAFKRDHPALAAPAALQAAELLSEPATYWEWMGEAACGGFHGDWYLRWADGHEAIVCEGCHEILLYRDGRYVRCMFTKQGYERLVALTGQPGGR